MKTINRWRLLATLAVLGGCAAGPGAETTATKAAPAGPLAISARAPYDGRVSDLVRRNCDLERKVPEILRKEIGAAVLADGPTPSGRFLELKIAEVTAIPGGGFSGAKTITVRGTLYDSGTRIGSFTARRSERYGNQVCVMLSNAAAEVAGDVRGWLASPGNESHLGEAK